MTKDETLLVSTLVVSSVSIFLFGILLFMVLISARFSRENQIQVGEDHDLGWHSSYDLCNCGSNLSDLYLFAQRTNKTPC